MKPIMSSSLGAAMVLIALLAAALAALSCDEGRPAGGCLIGCIKGSGYPCPCTPDEGCGGGAVCGAVDPEHGAGFCSIPCESDDDCVWDGDCTGERKCVLENVDDDNNKTCALTCRDDDDCPLTMRCLEYEGLKVCYPWTYE